MRSVVVAERPGPPFSLSRRSLWPYKGPRRDGSGFIADERQVTSGEHRDRAPRAQQAGLAAFGKRAAEGEELDVLLSDAAREVAESLGVGFVKVLEHRPDRNDLLIRAGFGWDEGTIGRATVGTEIESPAGFALQTGKPVISNNLDDEERFTVPDLLKNHQVKSAVNVIIKNGSNVFGVLEADSRERGTFDDADVKFMQGYANILSFVIEQSRLVEQNAQFARLQEMFFQELQHRVKNNNQQLISLIHLQLGDVTNIEARDNLEKVATRILALSRVNEQLVCGASPNRVELGGYLLAVVSSLFDFHAEGKADVRLETEIDPVEIGTAEAQAIGLIVNEFLTNSFKHGFTDGGTFRIQLQVDQDEVRLSLSDDGCGLSDEARRGLGFKLIEALTQQVGAEARWSSPSPHGTRLELTFQLSKRIC